MAVPYNIEKKKKKIQPKKLALVLGIGLIFGALSSLLIRGFFLTPVAITTATMEPTLKMGDSAYVYKWQKAKDLPIGEIVLAQRESGYLLARILGRPGDRIRLENKTLIRNGEVIPPELYPIQYKDNRPPLPADFTPRDSMAEIRVPEGHLFLLADNRDEAMDSRFIGTIPMEQIVGHFSP
jgi:signal peptidase I